MAAPPTEPPPLEPWLQQRLSTIFLRSRAMKFEASLYGPLNSYLATYFPVSHNFMVKPQATLRPAAHVPIVVALQDAVYTDDDARSENWDALELSRPSSPFIETEWEKGEYMEEHDDEERHDEAHADEECHAEEYEDGEHYGKEAMDTADAEADYGLGDVSMSTADSYAQHTQPGTKGMGIPDFVVVKATGALDGDTIVLVVEVKKRHLRQRAAFHQLSTYLTLAATKNRAERLRGVLIRGRLSTILEVRGAGGNSYVLSADADSDIPTTGSAFNEYINSVAADNWA